MPDTTSFRPECFDTSKDKMCQDPDCRKQIAAFHSITEERFSHAVVSTNVLRSYENAELGALRNVIENAVCGEKVGIMHDGTIKMGESNTICAYSVALLRGIFDQNPARIEVYAGNNAMNGKEDRLLRVMVNGVVKFYDMSDSQP